jgi:hypothetical protein
MVDSQHQVVDNDVDFKKDYMMWQSWGRGKFYTSNTCESIYIVYSTFVTWLVNGGIFVWWIGFHGMKIYFDG